MPKDPAITPFIKQKMEMLEPKLKGCVRTGDIDAAKRYMNEIQCILKPNGYNSRLMKNKNYLFEAALEAGNIEFAISGLIGVRNNSSIASRIYLESTSLLAICYVRKNDIPIAQKFVDETIKRIKNIKSDELRREFYDSFLNRIDDEMILSKSKEELDGFLDSEQIHNESIVLIQSKSEDELYELIGNAIPEKTIEYIGLFQKHNLQLLPPADRKFLPQPVSRGRKGEFGKKFTLALKRVVWKCLCDQKSDLYQAWSQGLAIVHDKKYISCAVVTTLADNKIGSAMIAASIIALAVRFGVNVFCELFEPETIMDKRKR